MDDSQRKGMNMILVLVISAILCASATLIAIMLVSNRNNVKESTVLATPEQEVAMERLTDVETDPEITVILPEVVDDVVDDQESTADDVEQHLSSLQLEQQSESVEQVIPTPVPDPIISSFSTVILQSPPSPSPRIGT